MSSLLPNVPETEIRARVLRMQDAIGSLDLDGVLIMQLVDLFYFTGMMQNGHLFIPRKGEPFLSVRKSAERAKESTPYQVYPLESLKSLLEHLNQNFGEIKRIGLELDVVPYNQVERFRKALPGVEFVDISQTIRELRMIKSPYEIEQLRKAARVQDEAIQYAIETIPKGIREIDLAARIEFYLRTHGHIGVNRTRGFNQELVLGAVLSGPESAVPSYFDGPAGGVGLTVAAAAGSGWSPIRPNEPIFIDFCACIEGYNFDQTRIAVWGELDRDLEEAYQFAREILREIERIAKPGVPCEHLYLHALQMVQEKGLADHFMGFGRDQAKFLGHGVGLEVDEYPVLARRFAIPLKPGMTIAIEPKFTFPGRGIVGIENTYLVTDEGLESLCITSEEIIRIS